jgi:hypothetical protein
VAVTPTDYAAQELALWEQALGEQLDAEQLLSELRDSRRMNEYRQLLPHVDGLATKAALLLAQAVNVKCTFRDHMLTGARAANWPPNDADET